MLTNRKSYVCCLWANLSVGSHIQNNLAAIDVYLFFDIVFLLRTAKPLISSLYPVKEVAGATDKTHKKRWSETSFCLQQSHNINMQHSRHISASGLGHNRDTWSHNSGSFDQSQQNCAGLSTGACTSSPRWRDLCLLQRNLLEITSVPKHRSGPPSAEVGIKSPFISPLSSEPIVGGVRSLEGNPQLWWHVL